MAAALTRAVAWLARLHDRRSARLILVPIVVALSALFLIPLVALVRMLFVGNVDGAAWFCSAVAAMAAYLAAAWTRVIGGNALLQRSRFAFYGVLAGLTIGAILFLVFAVDALWAGAVHPQNPADLVLLLLTAVSMFLFVTTVGARQLTP